jgi:hypothetical protein
MGKNWTEKIAAADKSVTKMDSHVSVVRILMYEMLQSWCGFNLIYY